MQENDELKAKDKKQRQQIEILEHNEKELAKKNLSNQKIIRMLTEKTKGEWEIGSGKGIGRENVGKGWREWGGERGSLSGKWKWEEEV